MTQQSKSKNLKANLIFNIIYQVLVLVTPFITSPYVARVLLPAGQGSYSFGNSIVSYFSLVAGFGFANYGTIAIAKCRDDKKKYSSIIWELMIAKGLLTALVTVVYSAMLFSGVLYSSGYPMNDLKVYLVFGLLIVGNVFDLTFIFNGLENFSSLCYRNIFIKVLNIALIFLFVKQSSDYFNYVIVMTVCSVLSALSTLMILPKNVCKTPISWANIGRHFKSSLIYFVPTIAMTLSPLLSKTVLGTLVVDPDISGYYESADKLVTIVTTVISSVNTVLLSRMSYLYEKKDEKAIVHLTAKINELYLVLALPCFFGLLSINRFFTPAFFGDAFVSSIPLVYFLAPKILLQPIYNILTSIYYLPKGKVTMTSIFLLIGMLFNLLLTYLLTKYFSAIGTALASTLTELLLVVLYVSFAHKHFRFFTAINAFWKTFDASLLMFIACFFVSALFANRFSNLVLSILMVVIGSLVYGISVLLFRESLVVNNVRLVGNKVLSLFKRLSRKEERK